MDLVFEVVKNSLSHMIQQGDVDEDNSDNIYSHLISLALECYKIGAEQGASISRRSFMENLTEQHNQIKQ